MKIVTIALLLVFSMSCQAAYGSEENKEQHCILRKNMGLTNVKTTNLETKLNEKGCKKGDTLTIGEKGAIAKVCDFNKQIFWQLEKEIIVCSYIGYSRKDVDVLKKEKKLDSL